MALSTLHDQARRLLDQGAEVTPWNALPVEEARLAFQRGADASAGTPPTPAQVRDIAIPRAGSPLPARLYVAQDATTPQPTMLYFHGGGFVLGSLDSHDALCRHLCHASGVNVLSVDYRLAPEHPYPAAADDAITAAEWLRKHTGTIGADPDRLAIGGDSAGANLAAIVCQYMRDRRLRPFHHQCLIYPMIDLRLSQPSHEMFSEGYRLTLAALKWFIGLYTPYSADVTNPRLSPLLAPSLADLPPAFILSAGFDPLRDEAKLYATALEAQGVPTQYVCYDDMIHGFCNMPGVLDRAVEALTQAGQAIKQALR